MANTHPIGSDELLRVHRDDDMLVALRDLPRGRRVQWRDWSCVLPADVPRKHKIAIKACPPGTQLRMYGQTVARALRPIAVGELLTQQNIAHATESVEIDTVGRLWQPPDVSAWKDQTFLGYRRADGRVGTRNYWIVIPLVFCENVNLRVMREAMLAELGMAPINPYQWQTRQLVRQLRAGRSPDQILQDECASPSELARDQVAAERIFPHVDGIRFLSHEGGCGGSYEDALTLCGLLAGYVTHPNVAGATVLSLGCQKSRVEDLQREIEKRNANLQKPVYIFEQQQYGSTERMLSQAIKQTFVGLIEANDARRESAPLSELVLGVECGGSDGFSGISANPAMGHCSDLLVALGGSVILSEFPELAGCEPDLCARSVDRSVADRFLQLMRDYEARLRAQGNGFDQNPSPGNVRDGLTTDAIKSAGAARKGGTSPIVDVRDYPERIERRGLNLLCTPGGDLESTSAIVGAGANIVTFSTGLGTPTGNAIAPVIKVSSNCEVARKMADIIDFDAGSIVVGTESVEQVGERMLELIKLVAEGQQITHAERLGQDDFMPWRRALTF